MKYWFIAYSGKTTGEILRSLVNAQCGNDAEILAGIVISNGGSKP